MPTKTVKNIQTTLSGEGIGSLVVIWDMLIERDIPSDRHEDDFSNATEEMRSVEKVRSVEFQVYDCVGVDITKMIAANKKLSGKLEDDLLNEVDGQDLLTETYFPGIKKSLDMVSFASKVAGF